MNGTIGIIFGRKSGTSSMAKALVEQGFPFLGHLDTRPFPAMPDGHYESFEIRDYDRKILQSFKLADNNPGLAPFMNFELLMGYLDGNPQACVVKEPALDLVWPVWVRSCKTLERPLVGVWCRRPKDQQAESLVRNYKMHEDNAYWCVEMYELAVQAATTYIPTLDVWLDDPDRVEKASEWFREHGIVEEVQDAVSADYAG